MIAKKPKRTEKLSLSEFAVQHQRDVIVPHCPQCKNPCCNLSKVVLDMTWAQTQALYNITSTKKAFDASLRDGSGPQNIRAQDGLYYAHGKACPAFDAKSHACGVYGTATKPQSCSDFPFYDDGGGVTVDARCEAVDVGAIEKKLRKQFGAKRVVKTVNEDFSFLVTFDVD